MAVLTAERSVFRVGPEMTATVPVISVKMKAAAKVFKGGLVATDATGYGIAGSGIAATGLKVWGIAESSVDNTSGASGALSVNVRRGIFPFSNHGADALVQADFGAVCYVEDDHTVRKTSATSTRSAAGIFLGFADDGVSCLVQVGNFSQTGV